MRRLLVATLMTATLAFSSAWATTIHVPADQPTIQAGIDAAAAGDTVLVACGTYYEHDIVMKSGICLCSETGEADCVTIDAQQLGRVFYCDEVDATASIVGFIITGGLAAGSYPDYDGGGMYCRAHSSPTIEDCVFEGNQARGDNGGNGGGLCCFSDSSPTLTGCVFRGNEAYNGGGGMMVIISSPTLSGCVFEGNRTGLHGGGMCYHGSSSSTLTDCIFRDNEADNDGGGMACSLNSSPALTSCLFERNRAGFHGGGISCQGAAAPTLSGCTLDGNRAGSLGGGGMSCLSGSSPLLTSCIIAFSETREAVFCYDESCEPVLTCCDVYANAGGDWVGCIADQFGVNGNFSADPMFCDPDNGNFMLYEWSPCAPDNNDCGVLIGAYPVGCGASPVEATSWSRVKVMYR